MSFTKKKQEVIAPTISCHAWNKDKSMIAICPNNNEIHIYKVNGEDTTKWDRAHVLKEHDHLVTAIDWAPQSNLILSSSQDRNAYVWNYENNAWKPTLVLLRLNRAATCAKWSPKENKFAVGSGAKSVSICYFEEDNDWWVSKMFKKPKSTVTSVAWHPTDNTIVAAASSDFKVRIFRTWIKSTDKKDYKKSEFGEEVAEFHSKGWANDVQFSPSGDTLAFTSQGSTVTFVDYESKEVKSEITTGDLPYTSIMFLSNNALVAAGHDFNPVVFSKKGDSWVYCGKIDEGSADASKSKAGGTRSAFMKFQQQSSIGAHNVGKKSEINTKHKNVINSLSVYKGKPDKVDVFTTSGLDGRILFWKTSDIKKDGFKL